MDHDDNREVLIELEAMCLWKHELHVYLLKPTMPTT